MTNEKKIVVAAIVFFALTITSGCATPAYRGSTASSEMERPLVVASSLRFDDVPIPAGFISIPTESFIYQTEKIRAGLFR
ncbi:MAG: hypothetical protein Q8O36_06565 [Candidatus Omnitrophota bacterium]|nr:hypothetical protein [Candidatus Omnitrophota bacterium]